MKKISKTVIAVGIIFAAILFNSCATDDVNSDATQQDVEGKTTKIPNNSISKSSCDCDVILELDLDLNKDGNVTANDLVYLQVILNTLDYNNDGCVDPPSMILGAGDFGIWTNNGGQHVPTNFRDYNHDGVTNNIDVFYAFVGIVPRFGSISGDERLCQEDIDCLLAYIVGNLDCN
jgi:hypothetical protein